VWFGLCVGKGGSGAALEPLGAGPRVPVPRAGRRAHGVGPARVAVPPAAPRPQGRPPPQRPAAGPALWPGPPRRPHWCALTPYCRSPGGPIRWVWRLFAHRVWLGGGLFSYSLAYVRPTDFFPLRNWVPLGFGAFFSPDRFVHKRNASVSRILSTSQGCRPALARAGDLSTRNTRPPFFAKLNDGLSGLRWPPDVVFFFGSSLPDPQ